MRSSGHSYGSGVREKSPCRQKVDQLTEKLQTIGTEDESRSKREFLVQRARNIYEKLEKIEQADDARFRLFKESLLKIEEELTEERSVRETFEEEKREAINLLEKEFNQLVHEYKKEVSSREHQLEARTDERFSKVRSDVAYEQRRRIESQSDLVRNVSDHIAELNGMIAAQRKNREDTYEILIKQLGSDILKLNEAISQTRKIREESHAKVYRLIEDIQTKLTREITVGVT